MFYKDYFFSQDQYDYLLRHTFDRTIQIKKTYKHFETFMNQKMTMKNGISRLKGLLA